MAHIYSTAWITDTTKSITVPAGNGNRVMWLYFEHDSPPTSVTYDGASASAIMTELRGGLSSVWRLVAPAATTANVVISGVSGTFYFACVLVADDVDQTTPERATPQFQYDIGGSYASISLNATSETGDTVFSIGYGAATGGITLAATGTNSPTPHLLFTSGDYTARTSSQPASASSTAAGWAFSPNANERMNLVWAARPATDVTTIFRAEFTGAANTALSSYTPEVGSFADIDSLLELDGNGLLRWDSPADSNTEGATLVPTVAASDFVATLGLQYTSGTGSCTSGLFFRRTDIDNLWCVELASDGTVILYKRTAGEHFEVGTWASGVGSGNTLTVTVYAAGDHIEVWSGGVQRIATTDSTHQSESGMRAFLYSSAAGQTAASFIDRIEIMANAGPDAANIFIKGNNMYYYDYLNKLFIIGKSQGFNQ